MLTDHADRICTAFAVNIEPQFGVKVANAADEIYCKYKPPDVNSRPPTAYFYRWPDERRVLIMTHERVGWQTLGLSWWRDHLNDHAGVVRSALDVIGTKRLKRIGFKVTAYLPLEMSHSEMTDLLFGSLLVPKRDLEELGGDVTDSLVRLDGKHHGFEYVLQVSPMTRQQVSDEFLSSPNLEQFIGKKYLDAGVKDFHDRITQSDSLLLDLDLCRKDVQVDVIDNFLRESLSAAQAMADTCVRQLRSKPLKKGK
jgi:hypothetical protein